MDVLGGGIAPRSGIAEQHPLARSAEIESGRQSSRTASHDDDVVRFFVCHARKIATPPPVLKSADFSRIGEGFDPNFYPKRPVM
jgi:hypothetical protein